MSLLGSVAKGILWAADPGASVRRSSLSRSRSSSSSTAAQFGQLYTDTLTRAQRYRRYHRGTGSIDTVLGNCAVNNSDLDVALKSAIASEDKAAIGVLNRLRKLSVNERVSVVRSSE